MLVAAIYEGTARAAIHALKYHGQRRVAAPLAALMAATWRASGARADVIVPVPLHASRARQRGFNQANLLARELARDLGIPLRRDALTRVRPTAPQARLPRVERLRNVAGAFALRPPATAALAGRAVLLVDDVISTGATIQAAASALRDAHPAAIYALALARPMRAAADAPDGEP
jgi:ComF family protein